MQEQANLDKKYLERVISKNFILNNKDGNFITFIYKEKEFFAIYVKDSFPAIGVASKEKENYPHFIPLGEQDYKGIKLALLCLFIKEELVEHMLTYEEKVDHSISQFIRLMNLTKKQQQKEIIKELSYHWHRKATEMINSMVKPNEELLDGMKIFSYGNKDKKGRVISKTFPYDKKYKYTVRNCLYFDVEDMHGLFPPVYKDWDYEYLYEIFFSVYRNRFNAKVSKLLGKLKVKKQITIILRLKELKHYEIGMTIHFKSEEKDFFNKKLCSIKSIEYINIINATIEHSLIRNGQTPMGFENILVIGAGSLGSYVVDELPKIGVKKIALVDYDNLSYDNISRHRLSEFFVGRKKVSALKELLEFNYSQVYVNAIDKEITSETISEIINPQKKYDLILVLTGNEDLQYMINKYLVSLDCFIPTIFCWLEANSIGAHALVMKNKEEGCYNCVVKSSFSYLKTSQPYIEYNGCGGTYTQYGISILLETTSMIIKILNKLDNLECNSLYSYKTDSINMKDNYFTDKYINDKVGINVVKNIKRKECKICD